jgi:hypothetical protein
MAEAVRDGRLQISISQKLPLKEARQGHIAMEKGVAGKILLVAPARSSTQRRGSNGAASFALVVRHAVVVRHKDHPVRAQLAHNSGEACFVKTY